MKKISKILFSMCSFFMTGMGIDRLYAATCTVNTLMVSGITTVSLPGVDYNCTPTAVYGVQDNNGAWWTVYGCVNCGTGDTYTKTNYGVMISSAFSCTIPVPYCVKNSGGTTGGGGTGGGSTGDDTPDVTETWKKLSYTCNVMSDCWGKMSGTLGTYDNGKIVSYSKCEGGYCYTKQIGGVNQYMYLCGAGYYLDESLGSDVVNNMMVCCVKCPGYEDDYNSLTSTYVDASGYTTSGIDYCRIDSYKELYDESGAWRFSTDCYYTE